MLEKKIKPPELLVISLTEQLKAATLDQELNRLNANTFKKRTTVNEKKNLLKNRILFPPHIKSDTDRNITRDPLPPLLNCNDDSLTDTETQQGGSTTSEYEPETKVKKSKSILQSSDCPFDDLLLEKKQPTTYESSKLFASKSKTKKSKKAKKKKTSETDATTNVAKTRLKEMKAAANAEISICKGGLVNVKLLEEKIIELEEEQRRNNKSIEDELRRQSGCIDILLNAGEVKKKGGANKQSSGSGQGNSLDQIIISLNALEQKVKTLEESLQVQHKNMEQLMTKYRVIKELEQNVEKRFQHTNADLKDLYENQTEFEEKI